MFRTFALIAATALMAGCAAQPGLKPLSRYDPANPQVPEAPVASIVAPLTLEPPPSAAASDTVSPAHSAGSPMQHMDMKGMGHGQTPAAMQPGNTARDMEEMHHHSHPGPATQPAATQALYTCKMHPQVISDQPGTCPICGMKLVPKESGK